jgi:hypothetical protein
MYTLTGLTVFLKVELKWNARPNQVISKHVIINLSTRQKDISVINQFKFWQAKFDCQWITSRVCGQSFLLPNSKQLIGI